MFEFGGCVCSSGEFLYDGKVCWRIMKDFGALTQYFTVSQTSSCFLSFFNHKQTLHLIYL